jgi:hypothetical protein
MLGGLLYGLASASLSSQPGMGSVSALVVLVCLTLLVGLLGAAGVGLGVAATAGASERISAWSVAGAAAGGMIVGAAVKLLGLDAFSLLFGQTPGDITGAFEGALLGGAIGLAVWLGAGGPGSPSLRRGVAVAALAGATVGGVVPLLGGRLMGGSLDLLARSFPASRLRLDPIGDLFGEPGFGLVSQMVTGVLEGALFCACVTAAMLAGHRRGHAGASPNPPGGGPARGSPRVDLPRSVP